MIKMTKKKMTREEVLHVADLCNLELSEKEIEKLAVMLTDTLGYIEILKELDTKDVKETYQVTGMTNIFQEEEETSTTLTQEEALSNAREVIKEMFATKAVFER